MKEHYRQGDILVLAVKKQNTEKLTAVAPENNEIVIAHGEATGHRHRFKTNEVSLFETPGTPSSADRILHARALLAKLRHDEHETIELPQGDYEVLRQSEYVAEKPLRVVAD